MLGGSFNVSSKNTDLNNSIPEQWDNNNIAPQAGIFISDKWVVGIAPSFSIAQQENDNYNYKSSNLYVFPFVRYYTSLGEKIKCVCGVEGINYGTGSSSSEDKNSSSNKNEYKLKAYSLGAFIQPGITYFITPKIGIETSIGSIGYGYTFLESKQKNNSSGTQEDKNTQKLRSGGLNLSSGFNLGIQFYL